MKTFVGRLQENGIMRVRERERSKLDNIIMDPLLLRILRPVKLMARTDFFATTIQSSGYYSMAFLFG